MNLPYDTYLQDCRITLYGGILRGVATLNISLDGSFTVYPPARLNNSHSNSHDFVMDSITILDGGLFSFVGTAEGNNKLNVTLTGSLHIQGGGEFRTNNIYLQGQWPFSIMILTVSKMSLVTSVFWKVEMQNMNIEMSNIHV